MLKKMLRLRHVEEVTALSKSTIYDLMGRGKFPRPVKLGARAVRWREEDIANWLDGKTDAAE